MTTSRKILWLLLGELTVNLLPIIGFNDKLFIFRVFDIDSNGYITRDELQRAMQMIGETVTESQLNDMLALADLDKDGRINYEGIY